MQVGWLGLPRQATHCDHLLLAVSWAGVLDEALQADLLRWQGTLEGWAGLLVVMHLLLRALAGLAVEDAHFVLPAELQASGVRRQARQGTGGGGVGQRGLSQLLGLRGVQCRSQRRKRCGGMSSHPSPFRVSRGHYRRHHRPGFLHKGGGWRSLRKDGHLTGFIQ